MVDTDMRLDKCVRGGNFDSAAAPWKKWPDEDADGVWVTIVVKELDDRC
jgi:hypothetical protein